MKSYKTAASIPDEAFKEAERLARRTKKSRSRLFSDALREYLAPRTPRKITQAMDATLAEIGHEDHPVGSGPGSRRPVVVVQCDALNRSRIDTVVCRPITSNLVGSGS